jgi:hypothetical protein
MIDESNTLRVVLGDEYDEELRSTVVDVLRELGAQRRQRSAGVGGSQEVETLSFRVGEREIVVEAETYMGLSISGDPSLVNDVERRVRDRLPRLL